MNVYVDVTGTREAEEAFEVPQEAQLRALGFEPVGHFRLLPGGSRRPMDVAGLYAAEDARWFRANAHRPSAVLLAPDGSAFVELSGYFGGPSIRFRSLLRDGAVVETHRRWDRRPVLIGDAATDGELRGSIEDEMRITDLRRAGRSLRVVTGDEGAGLWEAHRRHVDEVAGGRRTSPAHHEGLREYLELSASLFAHEWDVHRRAWRLGPALMIAASVTGIALGLAVAWLTHPLVGAAALLGLSFIVRAEHALDWFLAQGRSLARRFPPRFVNGRMGDNSIE